MKLIDNVNELLGDDLRQTVSKLPPEQRTEGIILEMPDFDFFELLDSVIITKIR